MVVLPSSLATHGPTAPIGLAYIAAALIEAGHEVTVIDAAGEAIERTSDVHTPVGPLRRIGWTPAEVVDRIEDSPDVIGITNMFLHEWPQVREIATIARERFPDAVIVVGGETPTVFWRQVFDQAPAVDAVVLGEGERTLLELVGRVVDCEPLEGMEGVALRPLPDGSARHGGLPTRMRQLDVIPRPAWELFPMERYFEHPFLGVDRGRSMPVMATRGCPYQCSFCSSPQMWTTRYVVREPEDVADEIAGYVQRYDIRNVNFCDLTAITKRSWTLRFCDALEARDLGITWQLPVGTRAEALDATVLRRLHDTGCRNITYAPESGSERMLAIYDKKVKLPHMLDSLRAAHGIGLTTHVNIIIGHPEETASDLVASARFLLRAAWVGCDDAAVMVFSPYPGSADFDRLHAEGEIEIDERLCYTALTRSSSAGRSFNRRFSARTLRGLQLAMLALFYAATFVLRPVRIVRFVAGQVSGTERTYLDQMVRSRRQARRLGAV